MKIDEIVKDLKNLRSKIAHEIGVVKLTKIINALETNDLEFKFQDNSTDPTAIYVNFESICEGGWPCDEESGEDFVLLENK